MEAGGRGGPGRPWKPLSRSVSGKCTYECCALTESCPHPDIFGRCQWYTCPSLKAQPRVTEYSSEYNVEITLDVLIECLSGMFNSQSKVPITALL